jgi:hypothetical protein
MNDNFIVEKLNRLAELNDAYGRLAIEKEQNINSLIPAELKAQIEFTEGTYKEAAGELNFQIEALQSEISEYVVSIGATVTGESIMAVYNKGRVTWDNKGLEGYSVAHPELLSLRKVGNPYVTFRSVGHDKG